MKVVFKKFAAFNRKPGLRSIILELTFSRIIHVKVGFCHVSWDTLYIDDEVQSMYRVYTVVSVLFASELIDSFSQLWSTMLFTHKYTGCPKKHGNSVTNSISSLFWISIVIPNFKSHNIIMSARVYLKKRVKDCKDVSIMSPQDEQWIRTSSLCLYTANFLFY